MIHKYTYLRKIMKLKKHLINPIFLGIFFLMLGIVSAQYIDTHITRFTIIDLEDESRQEDAEEEEYLAPILPLPILPLPTSSDNLYVDPHNADVNGNTNQDAVYAD